MYRRLFRLIEISSRDGYNLEDAAKSLVPFQGSALCGGAWGWMLPRAHSLISAAIKRRARLLWMTPSLIAKLTG